MIIDITNSPALRQLAYWGREFTELGGLFSYAPSLVDMAGRGATYVDRILKGAKPADLPVEQADQVRARD